MGRTPPDWLTRTTYAHRGLHAPGVPENSLAAALAAIERGFGIECDIQRSRDDHPMVFHDWELDRLTNGTGETEDYLADELEGLSLVGTSETPSRLQRFLEALEGRVPLLIEIKSQPDYDVEGTALSVAQLLERYNGPAAVMSFDPRVPQWLAKSFPEICRGLVGTDSL
ncbi:MAG: glycerophosphodiester phosphodiesterase family protein, partial [Pseudomonadota bacterium]